jgi:exo-beta-1,3-glucanase (GH17 family)
VAGSGSQFGDPVAGCSTDVGEIAAGVNRVPETASAFDGKISVWVPTGGFPGEGVDRGNSVACYSTDAEKISPDES